MSRSPLRAPAASSRTSCHLTAGRLGKRMGGRAVALLRIATLKPGTLFVSMNAAGSGFRVEDCRFGPNRARGFISNASYGEVVGCTFDRLESVGVLSRPSYQWLEGGASRNVRFRDCTFIDCGVFYGVHPGMLTTNECHRNIVFAGCRFKGPRARLEVQCCTGLALDANTFDLPEEKAVVLRKVVREAAPARRD